MSASSDEPEDEETASPWRAQFEPPARAAGIPDDAAWDDEHWRWISGPESDQRYFAMTGALLQERSIVDDDEDDDED